MTARRLYEVHFSKELITADQTLAVPTLWPARAEHFIDVAHHVSAAQIFVKVANGGATPPDTPIAVVRLQYNLGEDDDDEVAASWTNLLSLTNINAAGVWKSTVLADPLPRRIRVAREATATAWNDGWNLEAWLVAAARIGR